MTLPRPDTATPKDAGPAAAAPATPDLLDRNLAALGLRHAELAARLRDQSPAPLTWVDARGAGQSGGQTATLQTPAGPVSLASRYDPVGEAQTLLDAVDLDKAACLTVVGLGLGHAAELARVAVCIGGSGRLLLYEPDPAVLRAVLERRDLRDLLADPSVTLLCGDADAVDRAAILSATEPFAALLTQGTQLVTPPASRRRAAEAVQTFGARLAEALAGYRTHVATALVNASRTCRNLAENLGVYAAGGTTDELHGAAGGCVAVCVGAGPSLVKNIDLLQDPALRKRVVLITVQTALQPLLDRGIRPDFVTALDYSPICTRFYESLPPLPDVTLVAEPKAHAAVFDAYPGPVRTLANGFCDLLLGDPKTGGMATPRRAIPGGATVAHLSYYLARHLGCDPVVLVGQDLGFSDGLYYAPGTAVHRVWGCELGAFNTLETMEWQRVVRMRGHLRRAEDVHGRPVFTDEQMSTYLQQFERDFARDAEAGRTTLDATQGGLPKAHAAAVTLADALAEHADAPAPCLPPVPGPLDTERLRGVDDQLTRRRAEVDELATVSETCLELIGRMQDAIGLGDRKRLDTLFTKLDRERSRVDGDLKLGFAVVNQLNTVGAFRRARADRAIARAAAGADDADGLKRVGHQLDRDAVNIRGILEASEEAATTLAAAQARLRAMPAWPSSEIPFGPAA